MKKPIEVKKKLKKIMDYTACFAFLMFLQGVGAPAVFATSEINAKFTILWNLISTVVQSTGGVILLWHAFEFGASMQAQGRRRCYYKIFKRDWRCVSYAGCSSDYKCHDGIMKREGISSFFLWRNMINEILDFFKTVFSGSGFFSLGCNVWNSLIAYAFDMLQTNHKVWQMVNFGMKHTGFSRHYRF